ncbi:MAG: prolipoprotein diacylglyceryl transferase [Bryobacteraceae bacterium]
MLPQLVRIGDFFLPTYGLLVTIGFLSGLWLASRLGRRAGLDKDAVLNLGIYSALAGILGAKLALVLLDLDYYRTHPREIFSLSTLQAGGIFYGGLIAALAAAAWYVRRKRLPGWVAADVYAPAVALGHAFGRLGCFAAGCCWGIETHLPWAVTFTNPLSHQLFGTPLNRPLHPTQLYEALAEAAVFAVLYWRHARPHAPGTIIGLYLMLYSSARFAIEFVRAHDELNPPLGPLYFEQWVALALVAAGLRLVVSRRRVSSGAPSAPASPRRTPRA